ncbi:methyltransferase-like protein 7A, partial [Pollicipes pollicipes]|uniref:methyltransferase-like protein 7A n=1 Tax=Pollicipes pollicipes TaxID=41117 RepID=UPI0018859CF4
MLSALLDAGLLVSSGIACCWLLLLALRLVFGEKRWSAAGDALFALAMDRVFSRQIRERLDDTKARLFADLKTQLSADESLRQDSALNMLEIGVGTGANLEFYPAGSRLTCVDANPAFESYFRERCGAAASHLRPPLRFLVADAGDMPAVASDSMDAVVATLLFCNMERAAPVLSEVKRVLAPGGRFYFIEHVAAREGTWR